MIIAVPPNWIIWDHIFIKGPIKIQQLFDFVDKEYNVSIKGMYTYDRIPLIINREMLQYNIEKAFSITLKKEINQLRRILTFIVDGKNKKITLLCQYLHINFNWNQISFSGKKF